MKHFKNYFPAFFAFLLLFIVWQLSVAIFHIENWILPAPLQILNALWLSRDLILFHTTQTIIESLLGLFIAGIIGGCIAILMEWSAVFKKIMKPFLVVSQTIPFIVLAPLLVIWLGYGIAPKIIVITLACFFPIAINFSQGFRSVDANMMRLLQSMGADKSQIFRFVKLPASLPFFFSGLRLAGTYVIGVAVVSEWLGADRGLGIFLVRSAKSYLTDNVFAAIVVVTVLSLILVAGIERVAKLTTPWYYHEKEGVSV